MHARGGVADGESLAGFSMLSSHKKPDHHNALVIIEQKGNAPPSMERQARRKLIIGQPQLFIAVIILAIYRLFQPPRRHARHLSPIKMPLTEWVAEYDDSFTDALDIAISRDTLLEFDTAFFTRQQGRSNAFDADAHYYFIENITLQGY